VIGVADEAFVADKMSTVLRGSADSSYSLSVHFEKQKLVKERKKGGKNIENRISTDSYASSNLPGLDCSRPVLVPEENAAALLKSFGQVDKV
jgi:hypothetical protein